MQRPGIAAKLAVALVATLLSCLGAWWFWSQRRMDPGVALVMNNAPNYSRRAGYYTYVPNDHFVHHPWGEEWRSVQVDIDEHGLRNPPGKLTGADVVVLGDSFASGLNTDREQTFAAELGQRTGLATYDAGVDGFSTFQEARLLRDLLKAGAHPRTAVVLFYTGNDFCDNFLDYALMSEISFMGSATIAQAYFMHDPPPYPQILVALRKTGEAFTWLRDTAAEHGVRLVVVVIPTTIEVSQTAKRYLGDEKIWMSQHEADEFRVAITSPNVSYDATDWRVRRMLDAGGVESVSLLGPYREHVAERLYGWPDTHWTVHGQELAAEIVAEKLRAPSR